MYSSNPSFFIAALTLCYALSIAACSSDDQHEPAPDAGTSVPDVLEEDISRPNADAEGDVEPAEEQRLEITPAEVELMPGQTHQVEATLYDEAGRAVEDAQISWRVEDEEVARVSESGLVRGVEVGETTLIAFSGEVEASVEVRVGQIDRLEITPERAEIHIGEELQLALEVFNSAGEGFVPEESVSWTSSAAESAAVDADGLVTGLKAGNVLIEAKFGGLRAQATVSVEIKFVHLHCQPGSICIAIAESGELYTLGTNDRYPRPDGLIIPRFREVEVDEDIRFKSAVINIDNGPSFCAISTEDRVYCWGRNSLGELGQPLGVTDVDMPTALDTDLRFKALTLGATTACGLSDEGALYCWGDTRFGLGIGDPDYLDDLIETPVLKDSGSFSQIVGNGLMVCVQDDKDQRWSCLGQGSQGQLGNGEYENSDDLTLVGHPQRFQALAATHNYASNGTVCALDFEQKVWCWGQSRAGEFGQPMTSDLSSHHAEPERAAWDDRFVNISALSAGFCGETEDHQLQCWGNNRGCALGKQAGGRGNQTEPYPLPQAPIEGLPDDWALNTGNCALSESGGVWCWGFNRETGDRWDPVRCDPVAYRMHSYHD